MTPHGKPVLIIDDDPRNIFALAAILRARGFKSYAAAGMAEAFDVLQQQGDVGVILLDMMMPDMDGYEALPKLKTHGVFKNLPVVAVTAQAMVGDRERCLAAGADAYISKPVDIDALVQLLHTYQ